MSRAKEGARLQGNDNEPGSLLSYPQPLRGSTQLGPGKQERGRARPHTGVGGGAPGGEGWPAAPSGQVVDEAESQGQDLAQGVWSLAGTFGAAVCIGVHSGRLGEPQNR